MPSYPFHDEAEGLIHGDVESVFTWLDDHRNLAAHMNRSRFAMGGGQMHLEFDEQGGRAVGSCDCPALFLGFRWLSRLV